MCRARSRCTPAVVTVAANNATRAYGASNPALTVSYAGFANGDTAASITTPPTVTTTAAAASAVGTYAITASGAVSANYTFAYVNGTLTVTPATLTITANDKTKAYGAANPTLTVSYSGFVNGDTAASLEHAAERVDDRDGRQRGRHLFDHGERRGQLERELRDQLRARHADDHEGGAHGDGRQSDARLRRGESDAHRELQRPANGDTAASVTTAPTVTTTATAASGVGTYPITASGAASANYTFTYVNGSLTVTAATLTITANDKTKVYGAANPALSVSYSGFVNGDTVASLVTAPTVSTSATASSAAGTYPITASGAVANGNYTIGYVAGALTVTKAALTVTASDATRAYGAANPTLTVTYSGFVNGDTAASLTTPAAASTTATAASSAGSYPITASGAASASYTFTYVNGSLTVTAATLTITANDKTKVYGGQPGTDRQL